MSWISETLRAAVRERAGGRCEYCLTHEDDVLIPHEPDHIVAEQHGGQTTADNLAFACFHCNRRKGPNLASVDPTTGEVARLYQPRTSPWREHFSVSKHQIVGLTSTGRATVALLRLNCPERVALREALTAAGRFTQLD